MKLPPLKLPRPKMATPYLYILPYLILFIIFILYPIIRSALISLLEWDILSETHPFVGFKHYMELFTDPFQLFGPSFIHTMEYAAKSVPLFVFGSLLLAISVNQFEKTRGIFRMLFVFPMLVNVAAISILAIWIFDSTCGLLNYYLSKIGFSAQNWLGHEETAMSTIVGISLWWGIGFNFLLFLAALQEVPNQLYEAANLDGAGSLSRFIHITLPCIKPTMLFVCILQIISSFQIFGQVFIITGGGPHNSTRVVVQHLYETGFQYYQMGLASAMAWILFSVLIVFTLLQLKLFRFGGGAIGY